MSNALSTGLEVLGYGSLSREMREADARQVASACVGSWRRQTDIQAATGLGISRVRRGCECACAMGILEWHYERADASRQVTAWRATGKS